MLIVHKNVHFASFTPTALVWSFTFGTRQEYALNKVLVSTYWTHKYLFYIIMMHVVYTTHKFFFMQILWKTEGKKRTSNSGSGAPKKWIRAGQHVFKSPWVWLLCSPNGSWVLVSCVCAEHCVFKLSDKMKQCLSDTWNIKSTLSVQNPIKFAFCTIQCI